MDTQVNTKEKKPLDLKKILEVTKTVLVWLIVAFAVFMMIFTLVSVNMFDQNERSIFGYKFFVVRSDSMAATDFKAGDIIISKVVDTTTLKEGDIITFISEGSENYGETVTHKILEVIEDQYGSVAFVTYGTTKGPEEKDDALATYVLGKYVGKLPNLGTFFIFLKTTPGYIACILVPFLLLILSQGINTFNLFRKYKKEQMDQMNEEKAKIEAERAESQRMMAELLELKKQLAQQNASTETQDDSTSHSEE
jgi:signal peptidase